MSADADVYDSVQWYKDGEKVQGATGTTYTKESVTLDDAGKYRATFTGSYGTLDTEDALVTINVPDIPVTKVTLDQTSLTLKEEGTATLKATVEPTNATDKKITWKSSDTTVAKVSSSGVVTALKAGTSTITATAKGGSKATCDLVVEAKEDVSEVP